MNLQINDELLAKLKDEMPGAAFETTDAEFIESLIIEKLRQRACPGYELDPLTLTFSLHSFCKDAEQLFTKKTEFTVFNIVGMKNHNDIYGFASGDELLKSASSNLNENLNPDKLYRISGDRFLTMSTRKINPINTKAEIEIIKMKNLQPITESEWLFSHKIGVVDLILNASIANSNPYFQTVNRSIV